MTYDDQALGFLMFGALCFPKKIYHQASPSIAKKYINVIQTI